MSASRGGGAQGGGGGARGVKRKLDGRSVDLEKDLVPMMFGFGDDMKPVDSSVKLLESMVRALARRDRTAGTEMI